MGPIVDKEKCEGCGNCVDVCPADVFELQEGVAVVVNGEACLECGTCVEECPPQAITLEGY